MGSNHNHSISRNSKEKPLLWALILTFSFMLVEIIGGIVTGSLALLSDAAHMVTDVTALSIALFAVKMSKRPADLMRTFGYHRFEILAAAFNTILLFFVAIYILYEAYQRVFYPPEIHSIGMFVIAGIGLIINFISMRLLAADKNKSLNIKGAYLEVWSDMISSVGVIIAALIIYATGWAWVDSVMAVFIGLWILPRAWVLFKQSINVLLEGVPDGIDLNQLKEKAYKVKGVLDIHELHVWAITSDKISLTAHIVIDPQYDHEHVFANLREILLSDFHISHTTFQHERERCLDADDVCSFRSH